MLDVHLMIERPERHVADFVQAGADSITFHAEATPHVAYTADLIREGGAGVGLAINPATPVGALAEVVELLDMALCMTVNPGWGGQPFIAHSPAEDRACPRDRRRRRGRRGRRGHRSRDRAPLPGGGRERVRGRLGDLRLARPRGGLPGDRGGCRRRLRSCAIVPLLVSGIRAANPDRGCSARRRYLAIATVAGAGCDRDLRAPRL